MAWGGGYIRPRVTIIHHHVLLSLVAVMALSLQDTCLLNILLRVNQFPVEYLALLPRAIRQRLFDQLPYADILHLGDTALFSDLDEVIEDTLIRR